MNNQIFREYDLRGIAGKDFNLNDVFRIGQAFGSHLLRTSGGSVVVGRDCRVSSPIIGTALVKGLTASGAKVLDIGTCPTPVLYFALRRLAADGGLMITASHNPPEYNGFKICVGPDTIFGDEIQYFREVVEAGKFLMGHGRVHHREEVLIDYIENILRNIELKRPVRLAVDAGNGTGGITAGPILRRLGCDVRELFFEMDGNFPNHEPDPTVPRNMEALVETVRREKLELGIAFDGDADRLGVVDETGRIIWGDMLMVVFAREILKEKPGAKFIGEVKCSQVMYDDIRAKGGRAVMWKTGHSLIKQKMKEENADLAGEMSGHMFFKHRYLGFDDAIYAACRLLEIVSRTEQPLSSLFADLPEIYNTPEIRRECPEDKKFQVVEKVKTILNGNGKIVDVDGVRIAYPDGWGLVRASNTGPVLVLRFEAQSKARLEEIQNLVESALQNAMASI